MRAPFPAMNFLRCLLLLLGLMVGSATQAEPQSGAAPPPGSSRNLFRDLLGKSEAELDAKLNVAWQQLFYGDDRNQRIYYPVGDDMAYIADVGSADVRSEGMSYAMMIAVQLGHQSEFNRLWKWANQYMRHTSGPARGYFAWHCQFDGTQLDAGPASDGEEWFAMALFFAAHRWGDGEGIFNYRIEAQTLLREMLHKPASARVTSIFNRAQKQVTFVPNPEGSKFTDPSYHLPAFYELWARWSPDVADQKFWSEAATTSRLFFRKAAHPKTGLMPEYAHFDGTPFNGEKFGGGKGDFRFDAWRTLANVGLDYAWWRADPWEVEQSNRVLRFLLSHAPTIPNQFALDGRPLSSDASVGLISMAAVAGQAADPELARPFVQQLWDTSPPSGHWRYYNGLLYFLGLLQAGGRFQIHGTMPVNPTSR
jgi:oligosaccharide reducing-end xylanase